MPKIRNQELVKIFNSYFKFKANDMLDIEAGRLIVPVVALPVPKKIVVISDILLASSDKTFTVPVGKQWKLLYGTIILTTSATVGDRNMRINFRDLVNNNIYDTRRLNVQIASTVERYTLGQYDRPSEDSPTIHLLPIPVNSILPENFNIRIFDESAVDPTGDDMTVFLVVEEIEVTGE